MGILSWLTRRFSRGKDADRLSCFKYNNRNDNEESFGDNFNGNVEYMETVFDDTGMHETSSEVKEMRTKEFANTNFRSVGGSRRRAATMPAEMPSYYTNFAHEAMVRTEVHLHPFRKNRRGGICPNNVQDYYRSWDTRNNSMWVLPCILRIENISSLDRFIIMYPGIWLSPKNNSHMTG